ncbi:MAG: tetratricopeptide repeat protein [Pirellulales bacterium]
MKQLADFQREGKLPQAIQVAELKRKWEQEHLGEQATETLQTLSTLANLHAENGDLQQAKQLAQQLLATRRQFQGEQHWQVVDARLQIVHFERLEKLSSEQRARVFAAERLRARVKSLGDEWKHEEALPLAKEALAIRRELLGEDDPDTIMSTKDLGWMYRDLGKYAESEPLLAQALAARKRVQGEAHPDYAYTLNVKAWLYFKQQDYGQAEVYFSQALASYERIGREKANEHAMTLTNLASVAELRGDYRTAERHYRDAIKIRKQANLEMHRDHFFTLDGLALLYTDQGEFAAAEELLHRSLDLKSKLLGTKNGPYVMSLNNFANLYQRQGDYQKSEQFLLGALKLAEELYGKQHANTALLVHNLGVLYRKQDRLKLAEEYSQRALEIRKSLHGEQHRDTAWSMGQLGICLVLQERYDEAELLLRRWLEIQTKLSGKIHDIVGDAHRELGELYLRQGEVTKAREQLQQAADIYQIIYGKQNAWYATALLKQAEVEYAAGNSNVAEPLYRQSLEIIQDHLELTAAIQSERQQLAMVAANRIYLDNYLTCAAAFPQAREAAYRALLRWKGAVWLRQREGRAVADRPELLPVFQQLQTVARRLAKLALATPDPEALDAWRKQLDQLTQQKEELEQELARRSAEWREAKRPVTPEEVQDNLPEGAILLDFLEYWHWTPPQQGTPQKDTLQKGLSERHLLAFLVRRGQPVELVDLGPVAPLSGAIDQWREALGRGDRGRTAGQLLREKLWLPLEARLAGATFVLVSPDGALGRLPLAALPGKEPGRYLLEEIPLATIPFAQALPALLKEQKPAGAEPLKNLLLLGGVDYEADAQPASEGAVPKKRVFGQKAERGAEWRAFTPLAGTEGELASLEKMYRRLFEDDRYTTLEKRAATKARFIQEASRHLYLHVATHGFFAPPTLRSALQTAPDRHGGEQLGMERGDRMPRLIGHHPGLLSGLALAGANHVPTSPDQEDGILTAEEVQTLDLRRVELAVLSACETGLGETAGGEGLLGLQRAFQVAGARTTVASLWTVDDVHTRALMERFYQNVWEKEMSKLEALREAQLWMLREGHRGLVRENPPATPDDARVAPYYWAAFVLSGDWR